MPDDHDALPPGIGPHEGREFELMATGAKSVAYFVEIAPENADAIIAARGYGRLDLPRMFGDVPFTSLIVYRDGYEAAARELADLILTADSYDEARERRIGEILGYSEREIGAYIAWLAERGAFG